MKTESNETSQSSARSAFQEIPVNPSILKYIQRVGVGQPERRKRRQKSKARFISLQEEKDQLMRTRKARTTTPPPPFPSSDPKDQTSSSKSIRRFPVKLLKSVGNLETEFPKPSATMPEVVRSRLFYCADGRRKCVLSWNLTDLFYGTGLTRLLLVDPMLVKVPY